MITIRGDHFLDRLLKHLQNNNIDFEDKDVLFSGILEIFCHRKTEKERLRSIILEKYDSFAHLLSMSSQEWSKLELKDQNFFISLQLLREAARRFNQASLPTGDLTQNEKLLINYLMTCMARERVEQFRILFLDKSNALILDEVQGHGTVNQTPVYPREITRRCRELRASAVILAHNHPSGSAMPSESDVAMTQQIQLALSLIKVRVIDHYIIARSTHASFRELGLL